MISAKQLKILVTKPQAMDRFRSTGKLPEGTKPAGPLVELLKAIAPRDRAAIRGVIVDHRLGYAGSRAFQTAEQAFGWIHPDAEVFGAFPAESWRIKAMVGRLFLEDLQGVAREFPESIAARYQSLKRAR